MVDTPKIAGSPEILLTCADCGEIKPVAGHLWTHEDVPQDVFCTDCFAFRQRYIPDDHLREIGPASDTDEDGTVWLRRICPRCGGAGRVQPFRGTCFRCWGYRWTYVSPRNVNQVLKASATFQANRIPRSQP